MIDLYESYVLSTEAETVNYWTHNQDKSYL